MIRIIITFIICAGVFGCNKTTRSPNNLNVDKGLRDYLNVHSLTANYEIPAGDTAYLISLLEFEDGKLSRVGLSSMGTIDHLDNRILEVGLLWGTHESKSKVTLVLPGSSGQGKGDFWNNLGNCSGSSDTITRGVEHDGFVILGFAQSDLDNKGRTNTALYGNFRDAINEKKFIGALAVKTFKTHEEAKKENYSQLKIEVAIDQSAEEE